MANSLTRTEVFAVGLADRQEAAERAAQLNEQPPAGGWVPGSFRAQSARSTLGHKTWTVIGDKHRFRKRDLVT